MSTVGNRLNETFLKWLKEWKLVSERNGSQMMYVYRKALKSLESHKGDIRSSEELLTLKNFGPKICKRLGDRLKDGSEVDVALSSDDASQGIQSVPKKAKTPKIKKQKTTTVRKRAYCPAKHSGGYGLLIALYKASKAGEESVPKNELIQSAQQYCRESLTIPKSGSHYTAWNSMKTLIQHGYVEKQTSRQAYYSLTESGYSLAKAITKNHEKQSGNELQESDADCSSDDEETETEPCPNKVVKLSAHQFDVVLIVDSREQFTRVAQDGRSTTLISELQTKGVSFEIKALPVGDFAWVARPKSNGLHHEKQKDFILDYVVERKRYDDLIHSIRDNRWGDQKCRLKSCGVRNPIYLIEEFGFDFRKQDSQAIQQAICNAEIIDGLSVYCTKNINETLSWLANMTNYLKSLYCGRDLFACTREQLLEEQPSRNYCMTYSEFERNAQKVQVFKNSEMFLKFLLTFRGVSVEKASAVLKHYKTIAHLYDAYEICEDAKCKEEMLACLKWGEGQRNLGPAISRKIARFYCTLANEGAL